MSTISRRPTTKPIQALLTTAIGVLLVTGAWAQPTEVPGLSSPALVLEDGDGISHICGRQMRDAVLLQGFVDAQDRFFQMDLLRRQFSGDLAELLGEGALPSDVQLRTLGLRRAAQESLDGYAELASEGSDTLDLLEAYAEGVNHFLAEGPLPPEYGALELTSARPWTPVDSVVIGKGLAFGLSFDLSEIDLTTKLAAYTQAGDVGGFDGAALLFDDTHRSAPFDSTVSIPSSGVTGAATLSETVTTAVGSPDPRAVALAERYRDQVVEVPLVEHTLSRKETDQGSNWWVLSGELTESGFPILANDPHLALDTPAIFHETHLLVSPQPRCGIPETAASGARFVPSTSTPGTAPAGEEVNVNGVGFAGVPGVILGCNQRLCWGATTNPMDVTDVYLEELTIDPATGLPTHTLFRGEMEPVTVIPQTFLVNQTGDDQPDNLTEAPVDPLQGGITVVVPRRNRGPIVQIDASTPQVTGLSVQYTGWRATFELEAFLRWNRAEGLDDFVDGLQFFDVGSQNWSYADVDGTVAYFTSAEMPIREDLQTLGAPDGGVPPFLIRDGTGELQHEWLPVQNSQPQQTLDFEILPFEEMPQVVDPVTGYVANANNDPVGTTLDNNPLNQLRPDGGIYYLNPGYASLRVGRIDRLIQDLLEEDGSISRDEVEEMQGNNQLLDAELVVPFLTGAFDRASEPDAPLELTGLADDPQVVEAVERLRAWDFSTPTGIAEGYDPGDDPADLPVPGSDEIDRSVAATVWSVFRGELIRTVVDDTLAGLGLGDFRPGSRSAYTAVVHLLRTFESDGGVGASGVDFFSVAEDLPPAQARDLVLLRSLRRALDLLAGDAFTPAFGGSTELDDYRWGRLHRIVFDHPLGGPFDIPPAAGFTDLAPELPGISRAGGYEAVDASSHSPRADDAGDFMFGSGPARRFVGELDPAGIAAEEIIPGGQSGVLGSPHYASQLPRWLTNRYHPLLLTPESVAAAAVEEQDIVPGPCEPGPTTLCLLDDRFRVEADWTVPGLGSGPGLVADSPTELSGNFYFFDSRNWEILVKMVDGCDLSGHFWVFAGSATHAAWELTVTDTRTGTKKGYSNAFGEAAPAILDTAAFTSCP